jgi:predicted amidophosphoribosyltransferase
MRQRHIPRLCQSCGGPMARQTETCWRCGTRWAAEDEPRTRLRLIRGAAPAPEDNPVLLSAANGLG